jgi:hypothetical protein
MTPELQEIALNALTAYLHAPSAANGRTPVEAEAELDSNRVQLIERSLKPLLANLSRKVPVY